MPSSWTVVAVAGVVGLFALGCKEKKPVNPPAAAPAPAAAAPTPAPEETGAAQPVEPPPQAAPTPDEPEPAPAEPPGGPRTLPSGVVVEDLKIGEGAEAERNSIVAVHYRGTLTTGQQFDASDPAGDPVEFPLANLIPGWQEGIPGMKVGGVRRLTIPAEMGYGGREIKDAGGEVIIPANSDLVFEITLVGVK